MVGVAEKPEGPGTSAILSVALGGPLSYVLLHEVTPMLLREGGGREAPLSGNLSHRHGCRLPPPSGEQSARDSCHLLSVGEGGERASGRGSSIIW